MISRSCLQAAAMPAQEARRAVLRVESRATGRSAEAGCCFEARNDAGQLVFDAREQDWTTRRGPTVATERRSLRTGKGRPADRRALSAFGVPDVAQYPDMDTSQCQQVT